MKVGLEILLNCLLIYKQYWPIALFCNTVKPQFNKWPRDRQNCLLYQGFFFMYLTNRPQFSIIYTLIDHRNDFIKCSKLKRNHKPQVSGFIAKF